MLLVTHECMISERVVLIRRGRGCTMICATIILCYLFTYCTHQAFLAADADSQAPRFALRSDHEKSWRQNEVNKEDNVHRLMSEQDLRRTFQVDSHDQVPEYEILKLSVDPDRRHDEEGSGRKLIVMKLSTFGKEFKLRLKRNVDFQQRIKDMKLFMAESTKDGQLRYTEVKNHPQDQQRQHQHHHHHHQQEEQQHQHHQNSTTTTTSTTTTSTTKTPTAKRSQEDQLIDSLIGSTYHDEDNLAALLIDHDSHTGQLRVDGTIGNDFVIKPMPQAAMDAASQHIVYRQRPSADESSSEHQNSFMASPSLYSMSAGSMEKLAMNFSPQRLRGALEEDSGLAGDQMIDETLVRNVRSAKKLEEEQDANDPLDGQFYLEPGSVTGTERAGHSDWSLIYGAARTTHHLNATSSVSNATNGSLPSTRFKRQAAASRVRRKRQAPDTVWPEVLLVVDYDSFLLHGGDSRDVKRYFVNFWNGVDLRYKLLVHPHIRISLAGMIVAKDRDATPYLERNRLRAPNADAVDAAGALTDMGKYLYREDRLPTYDLAVVITKLDMCRRRYEGGRCNRGTAGFAYVGGACVVNKRLEKVNSVAIIEDSGGFSGIIVAAHEVGHLLGCVHDGSPPPSYLGGPGATHCPWEDGFIMSDLRHTERGFRWSQCSVEQFKHFLNGETATCLYNYPHESQMLHRLLPGTMLSLDEQCKRDRGTNACFKDARVCAQLFCFDSASGYCVSYRPAAEGSPCGEGQVCRNGKCVGEIENIIPDYTHQTPSVVARRPTHSVTRLADNGLSASSASAATAPPDSKLPAVPVQLTSRIDTFTVNTPLGGGLSTGRFQFGGRHQDIASTPNGIQHSSRRMHQLV